jgi:hypothetical protein
MLVDRCFEELLGQISVAVLLGLFPTLGHRLVRYSLGVGILSGSLLLGCPRLFLGLYLSFILLFSLVLLFGSLLLGFFGTLGS